MIECKYKQGNHCKITGYSCFKQNIEKCDVKIAYKKGCEDSRKEITEYSYFNRGY